MLPEAILKFDPGSASAETTRVRGRARLGQMQGRARGTAQLPWPCFLRFPSSCPAPWRAALLTCGRQQQGAVLPVQVLHRCDPGVPWVPVVEIIQFFPFLPVPETGGGKNTRSVLGSLRKLSEIYVMAKLTAVHVAQQFTLFFFDIQPHFINNVGPPSAKETEHKPSCEERPQPGLTCSFCRTWCNAYGHGANLLHRHVQHDPHSPHRGVLTRYCPCQRLRCRV